MTLASIASARSFSSFALIEVTRQGIPASMLSELAEALSIDRKSVASLLHISERTLSRRIQQNANLTAGESDRAVRLARLIGFADDMIGNTEKARDWLKTPNRALDGSSPLDLIDTDTGVQAVRDVLGRIAYGVYS